MIMPSNNWVKASGDLNAIGIWVFRSPSPLPAPQRRGRMADSVSTNLARREWSKDGVGVSLSPGERAGVRGNGSSGFPAARATN